MVQMIVVIEVDQANRLKVRRKVIAQMMNMIGGEIQHFQRSAGQFRHVFDGVVREIQHFDVLKRTQEVVIDQMDGVVLKAKFNEIM